MAPDANKRIEQYKPQLESFAIAIINGAAQNLRQRNIHDAYFRVNSAGFIVVPTGKTKKGGVPQNKLHTVLELTVPAAASHFQYAIQAITHAAEACKKERQAQIKKLGGKPEYDISSLDVLLNPVSWFHDVPMSEVEQYVTQISTQARKFLIAQNEDAHEIDFLLRFQFSQSGEFSGRRKTATSWIKLEGQQDIIHVKAPKLILTVHMPAAAGVAREVVRSVHAAIGCVDRERRQALLNSDMSPMGDFSFYPKRVEFAPTMHEPIMARPN